MVNTPEIVIKPKNSKTEIHYEPLDAQEDNRGYNELMLESEKPSDNIALIEPQNTRTKIDPKSFSYSTLVCLLPFGDYQLLTLMIQVISLTYKQDEKISAATSYMKSFYNICLLSMNSGILNALGSYGAQSCGIDNFKRYNCCLR